MLIGVQAHLTWDTLTITEFCTVEQALVSDIFCSNSDMISSESEGRIYKQEEEGRLNWNLVEYFHFVDKSLRDLPD